MSDKKRDHNSKNFLLKQVAAERDHLEEECELLTELLMLKHYKNLTDNRLNMSSARRRSIPQKRVVKRSDLVGFEDSKVPENDDHDINPELHEVDHISNINNEEDVKDMSTDPL